MRTARWYWMAAAAAGWVTTARAADHADAPNLLALPAADINDVYVFRSSDREGLVLAMSVNRFASGANTQFGGNTTFDPDVLYRFHIDTSEPLDGVADYVIRVQFNDNVEDANGTWVRIVADDLASLGDGDPVELRLDDEGRAEIGDDVQADLCPADAPDCVKVFAGLREDPFFFDLQWFIDFPASSPLSAINDGDDFYHNMWNDGAELINEAPADTFAGTNVSMIVIEFPLSDVLTGKIDESVPIGVWASTAM